MDSTKTEYITRTQTLLFNGQFVAADSVITECLQLYPDDPGPRLFRAAALVAEMAAAEENLYPDRMHALLDSVNTLTRQVLDTCEPSTAAWMYLLRGHARAYESLWEARFGSFVPALRLAFAAHGEYKIGLGFDSSLYDLYAGIGTYHYWKSAKAGVLRWLGIFKNEKDRGIRELHLVVDSSIVHRDMTRSTLIWIRIDQEMYDSAISIASDLLQRYPDGMTFLWPIGLARYKQEDYYGAMETFTALRTRLANSPGNYFNLIECDYYIGKCLNWLSRRKEAQAAAARYLEYEDLVPNRTLKRQRHKINFLKRMANR